MLGHPQRWQPLGTWQMPTVNKRKHRRVMKCLRQRFFKTPLSLSSSPEVPEKGSRTPWQASGAVSTGSEILHGDPGALQMDPLLLLSLSLLLFSLEFLPTSSPDQTSCPEYTAHMSRVRHRFLRFRSLSDSTARPLIGRKGPPGRAECIIDIHRIIVPWCIF